MNLKTMMMLAGTDCRLLDDNPGADGLAPAADAPAADAAPATDAPAETTDSTDGDLSSVTLGEAPKDEAQPAGEAANPATEQPKPAEGDQPKDGDKPAEEELTPEAYAKAVTFDETIAKDVELDNDALAAVAPILKELGVKPADASRLVNALAMHQMEVFKNRNAERFADNKRMHDEALQKYSRADFQDINAGIDHFFKPGGIMNYVIRNSEVGNDPEFLALMKWCGTHLPTNAQPAGGAASGTTGQPAGYQGIAQAWK